MQSSQHRSAGENQLPNCGRKAPKTVVFPVPSTDSEFRLASTKGHCKRQIIHGTTLHRMSHQAAVNSRSKCIETHYYNKLRDWSDLIPWTIVYIRSIMTAHLDWGVLTLKWSLNIITYLFFISLILKRIWELQWNELKWTKYLMKNKLSSKILFKYWVTLNNWFNVVISRAR